MDYDFLALESEKNTLENDCKLAYDEELEYYSVSMKDESGTVIRIGGDAEVMNNMIVGIEIIDYHEEGNEQEN